jgi:undecaprenyl-diphosphatase
MDHIQALILGMVQGLTEFLPISSSAHLILVPEIFGWPDQGIGHDVAAHAGTLAAVVWYFRADLAHAVCSAVPRRGNRLRPEGLLFWHLVIATVPIVFAGALLHGAAAGVLRGPLVIASANVVFAALLWWADRAGAKKRDQQSMGWRDALLIGFAQCLAIIPGTSRAGVTITAGLLLGLNRVTASRFSFLLSIPTIAAAAVLEGRHVLAAGVPPQWSSLAIVAGVSMACALLTIHAFLKFVERTGMLPYVVYRLLLGAVLFAVFL